MRLHWRAALAAAFLASGLAAPAFAAPANNLRELFANLGACMKGVGGDPGEQLTVAFSLKRDGSLFGKPHITYSRLPAAPEARRRFIDGVAARFSACLPTPITDGLGGAIAGRRLTLRFVIPRRETST
ncbi:hypothetical protein K9U39_08875 [Rhodoblastus acidophilus]|uniref:TonB C-terminal domain-containing protein n=1 Tax=Candidatus Rhodoblastus alkanivorans TaxID=2954117 RepID=A0ABS9Z7Z3_9HYPH|nr:hypothetical protein [Candidatus Rhodoblastus alkanivorans]MCI4678956.1 hypothetical protein [Candidatus Rhodoblastus alkanivorans]MCI4683734.1 hypothetical protein [Candidatus Rhodoblastus alkanivorans]MDI4641052.1 hypothetical protein [Rhodoblastus acidophilus]